MIPPPRVSPTLPTTPRQGFSLVELLVVIGIISVLAVVGAVLAPSLTAMMRSSQLTQAGQAITDQLALARQTALSKSRTVEVRIYQYGSASIAGENVSAPSTGKYRALQLFELTEAGTYSPLEKIQPLPSSVVIDSGTSLSSLFTLGVQTGVTPISAASSYRYISFRFRSDGSTDLAPKTSNWFLTLHSLNDGDKLSQPNGNFYTVQIDPSTGHIQGYRP